jgi:hypothetical protein
VKLQPLTRQDFEFRDDVQLDADINGFTDEEIRTIVEPNYSVVKGAKGAAPSGDERWWDRVWRRSRQVAPELYKLKSEFGYQANPLLTNLVDVAKAQDTKLDGSVQERSSKFNFYMMRCGVYIAPDGGEQFEALKFEVRYKDKRASTYAMLPSPEDKTLLEATGKADIGVDGSLKFGLPATTIQGVTVGANVKASLETKFIVSFHYELKTALVDAFGIGNPFCRWLMHKGDKLRNDVVFYPIIATPKSVIALDCEFKAYFKIGHPSWKHSEFYLKPSKTVRVDT